MRGTFMKFHIPRIGQLLKNLLAIPFTYREEGGGYVIILKHSWESASYATRLQYFSPILEPPPTLEPLKV